MLQKEMKIGLSDVEKVEMKNGIKSEVLTSVAGGSPKGTYADLTALQSAFPNGAPGVYLTSNNGHWYYWNSTAWTDGGVYQSSGIADRSIDINKLSSDIANQFNGHTQYLKKANRTLGKLYNGCGVGWTDIRDNAEYLIYEPLTLKSGTYHAKNLHLVFTKILNAETFECVTLQNVLGTSNVNNSGTFEFTIDYDFIIYVTAYYSNADSIIDTMICDSDVPLEYAEGLYEVTTLKNNEICKGSIDITKLSSDITEQFTGDTQYLKLENRTLGKFYNLITAQTKDIKDNANYLIYDGIPLKSGTYHAKNLHLVFTKIFNPSTASCISLQSILNTSEVNNSGVFEFTIAYDFVCYPTAYFDNADSIENSMLCNSDLPINYVEGVFRVTGLNTSSEEVEVTKTIHVGIGQEYTTLRSGIAKGVELGCRVIVHPGTYDLKQEFAVEIASAQGTAGIPLSNGVEVIFMAGSYVKALFDNTSRWAYDFFEPFKAESDFTLNGLNIEASNCRYCVHDDLSGWPVTYYHRYINCVMKYTNTHTDINYVQCIGGGMGQKGYIEIDGGVYTSNSIVAYSGCTLEETQQPISYHNGYASECDGKIFIKNVYLADKGHFRFGMYGSSIIKTPIMISGCSMYSPTVVSFENSEYNVENFELIEWNNTIRES